MFKQKYLAFSQETTKPLFRNKPSDRYQCRALLVYLPDIWAAWKWWTSITQPHFTHSFNPTSQYSKENNYWFSYVSMMMRERGGEATWIIQQLLSLAFPTLKLQRHLKDWVSMTLIKSPNVLRIRNSYLTLTWLIELHQDLGQIYSQLMLPDVLKTTI